MKIVNKQSTPNSPTFGNLKQGAVFYNHGALFIKSDTLGVSGVTAIRLDTGATYSFANNMVVAVPKDVEVVVYD